jgi:uncharacterized membrane protein
MAYQDAIASHQRRCADPTIREIGTPDVFDILAKGVADFNEKPSHPFFLTPIYPLVILFLARLAFWRRPRPSPVPARGRVRAPQSRSRHRPVRAQPAARTEFRRWTSIMAAPGHATRHLYRKVVAW